MAETCRNFPLAVIISRLTEQKGLDLVDTACLEELLNIPVQLAVIGVGEHREIRGRVPVLFRKNTPEGWRRVLIFDEHLSRRFYAGADMILVPSLFEPCGLTQMIAMRYGTLPVVRETGGLKDSVRRITSLPARAAASALKTSAPVSCWTRSGAPHPSLRPTGPRGKS